jgi:hypothetical protein
MQPAALQRGWEAEIKTDDKIAGMIDVDPNGGALHVESS